MEVVRLMKLSVLQMASATCLSTNLYPNDRSVASYGDCLTHTVAVVVAKAVQLHIKMRQQFHSTVMFNFGPHLFF